MANKRYLKGKVLGLSQPSENHCQVLCGNSFTSHRSHPPFPMEKTYDQLMSSQRTITQRRMESREQIHFHWTEPLAYRLHRLIEGTTDTETPLTYCLFRKNDGPAIDLW